MRGCNKKKKAKYIVIVFFAIIILGRIFIPWALEPENFRDTKNKINSFINRYTIPDSYNAKSLIAVDLSNNNDFVSKRANEQQTPASLAKLFVIDYATTLVDLDDVVLAKNEAISLTKQGSSVANIKEKKYYVKNLFAAMLVPSGNDAAYVLADYCGGIISPKATTSKERIEVFMKNLNEYLKYEICKSKTLMINENSGHDIIYQKNKVENLKIANQTMNHILIYPNETFSFYYLVRNSRKYGSYKDGLILVDGKIVAKKGGGICHLSNLLYYLFLMSPLTVVERHGHKIKSFPNPDKSSLEGIDATISSGWLDLKVKNETNNIYQIDISFDENYMYGKILSDKESTIDYKIVNGNLNYIKENNKIYECVEVIRIEIDKKTKKEIKKEKLYDEKVLIKYELPSDVKVEEM